MLGAGAIGLKAATLTRRPLSRLLRTKAWSRKPLVGGRVAIAAGGGIAFAAAGTVGARPANAELSL